MLWHQNLKNFESKPIYHVNGSINNGKDINMLLVNPVTTTNRRLRKNNLHEAENYVTGKIEIHEIK